MTRKKNSIFYLSKYFQNSYFSTVIFPLVTLELFMCTLLYNNIINKNSEVLRDIYLFFISNIVVGMVILLHILHTHGKIVKVEKEKEIQCCEQCSIDNKKYLFLRHNLISLDNLIIREKKLASHATPERCKVYNYTTLRDTFSDTNKKLLPENKIENIIKINRNAGVEYKVFYLEDDFLRMNHRNQEIYGENNLIDCRNQPRFFSDAEFDYLLHITPENTTGYVAVCFLSETWRCSTCAYSSRQKDYICDYKNVGVTYKILSVEETSFVQKRLNSILDEKGNVHE